MGVHSVGIVGIGAMGSALGARLLECGWDVWGYDSSETALQRASELGIQPVSLVRLAERPVILTSLPDDRAVEAVTLGSNGLLAHMKPGSVLVDLSTVLPNTIRRVASRAQELGIGIVDCPVSGGPVEARAGQLVLLAGAADIHFGLVEPVLAQLGEAHRVGSVGEGKVVKIVNNVMTMGNVLVAAEAFVLGQKAGVDGKRLFEVLAKSGGRSHHLLKRFPHVLKRDFTPRFALQLAEKDLHLAMEFARELQYPMPVASLIHQLYKVALGQGLGGEDMVAVIKLYEQWAAHQTGYGEAVAADG